jgi:pimeloyl-ACP methyl ester carboxylesterase
VRLGVFSLAVFLSSAALAAVAEPACAEIATHLVASGSELLDVEVRGGSLGTVWKWMAWDDLEGLRLAAGRYQIRVRVNAAVNVDAVAVPVCAGAPGRVTLDGDRVAPERRTVVRLGSGSHAIVVDVNVSRYEHRIACGSRPVAGMAMASRDELGQLRFASPRAREGGGSAVVFVPPAHDWKKAGPLLVGAHPWNGDMWTYAAYVELLREAAARDVVLLMPSGLGNSLYTESAEDEVMLAIDALSKELAVDPRGVSIWGASMGGAGATTIGFHHPDKFASITSYFGDSKYDLTTYVRSLIPDETSAHKVNALDVVENVRHVPVWLVHGESDTVSPIAQSEMLDAALRARHYVVRFDRVPGMGHEGALVARYLADVVARAASARVPEPVTRVTYRSTRTRDVGAYGVRIVRASTKDDAFVDIERKSDGVHVLAAIGVRTIVLARGALGAPPGETPPIVIDGAARAARDGAPLETRWDAAR